MSTAKLTRERLDAIPEGTELLRQVRFMPVDAFDDCSDAELDNAARWLRAAAYSAHEGARRIESVLYRRQTESPSPCSSAPNVTPPSTSTAELPPAAPSQAPSSSSSSKTTAT